LFAAKNVPAEIKVENKKISTEVTSLSVVINPHVSGNFCYDFNINSQSDYLGVGLCERMGILARLKTIISLTHGKFMGLPKTRSWMAREVEIKPDSPTPLELDGGNPSSTKNQNQIASGNFKNKPMMKDILENLQI
jgi:diacylglycerol kinase family enzyme